MNTESGKYCPDIFETLGVVSTNYPIPFMTLAVNSHVQSGLGGFGEALDGQRFQTWDTSFDPETQVEQTMPIIQDFASTDSESNMVRFLAFQYANAMPGASKAEVAWKAAKDHLVFVDDQTIANKYVRQATGQVIEVLRRPVDVILFNSIEGRKAEGDCDDHSMFTAAVGAALGADVRFVTVAANPAEPGVLSHIYTSIDGVPCDASHGDYAGWEVPAIAVSRRQEYGLRPLGLAMFGLAMAFGWYVLRPWLAKVTGL